MKVAMKKAPADNIPVVALQQVGIPHYRRRFLEKLGSDRDRPMTWPERNL